MPTQSPSKEKIKKGTSRLSSAAGIEPRQDRQLLADIGQSTHRRGILHISTSYPETAPQQHATSEGNTILREQASEIITAGDETFQSSLRCR